MADYHDIKQVDRRLAYSIIKPSFTFCDVGGAAGVDAIPFSLIALFGICLDIDRDALKRGKKSVKALLVKHKIDFIMAAATNIPFRNDVFDLVTSFSVIDHLPNKDSAHGAVKEFSRITKPGGYVVVTVPNRLFIMGTVLMKIRALTQVGSIFFKEIRFTPKEIAKFFKSSGLVILRYDSKYPTIVGSAILKHNIPKIFVRIPLLKPLLDVAAKTFQVIETLPLKLLGARIGLLSQKPQSKAILNEA